MFALLIHIYYQDSWEKIFRHQIKSLQEYSPLILVNLCLTNPGNARIISAIKTEFPGALVIATPNKGKDIGGKLALIDFIIKTGRDPEYLIFLHDKISPHSITGDRWRTKLFSIIDPVKIRTILDDFRSNKKVGIIGAKDFIKNEYDEKKDKLETTNSIKLRELMAKYHLTITNYTFIAGTMFWIRGTILKKFFSTYSPLSCRATLEDGNPTDQYEGTYTHSWERIFCWLANDQGYVLKGI
jgi:lipopolysaccharide biosynthesis protein